MTTFLRHRLWPAFALLLVLTIITGFIYPVVVTAIAQVAFPKQANGSFIVDRGRPDDRLVAHRPGVQRPEVLRRPPVGRRRRRLRRLGIGRVEPRADQPGADRPDHAAGRCPPRRQRRRAHPGRPRDDLRVRPRSGHQPGRRGVPGRRASRRPGACRSPTSGRPSPGTPSSPRSASSASLGSTSCSLNLDLDGLLASS